MPLISDVIIYFYKFNFLRMFFITNLHTRIVERNNDFLKKNLDLPWYHLKIQFLRVSRQKKNRRFFPSEALLSRAVGEWLSKCPNSKKTPLPYKIPGYAPEFVR